MKSNKRSESDLEKREVYAAMCMQGLMSLPDCDYDIEEMAEAAVRAADALLAELDK